ncbi:MAG: hypothetical protein H0U03_13985 [Actinobacteria bacterium]|nr:hypothetical protein [Actinomycetota bacterium]
MRLTGGRILAGLTVAGGLPDGAGSATGQAEFLPGRIVPAKSIGPLRLGMSEQAARRALRKLDPGSRLVRRIRRGTATEYVEYSYPIWYTSYDVGYLGRPGKRRVVLIITHVDENKTREGVGVSALQTTLLRTYGRRLACRQAFLNLQLRYQTECRLGPSARRHTVFVVDPGDIIQGRPPAPARVSKILVREPFQRSAA